jgi:general stress protein 26
MDDLSSGGDLAKVAALIREIRIALLTTVDPSGHLRSRPLQLLQVESNHTLWFFTDWNSHKVAEIEKDERVSLGFADPARHTFVVVSGTARLLRDPDKARQLWSLEQRAYYPDGPQDSRLALLRVQIEHAEYWLAPGRTSYLVAAARAALTGEPAGIVGTHREVDQASPRGSNRMAPT